jgi:hypothetical protein
VNEYSIVNMFGNVYSLTVVAENAKARKRQPERENQRQSTEDHFCAGVGIG